MKQIINGSGSQPRLDYLSMKMGLEEAAAHSETLQVLGNAIRQHREILQQPQTLSLELNR